MGSSYLHARRAFLLENRNADGGWGYFPQKQSWLEPTAYAILALHGAGAEADVVSRKALDLVMGWQNADGSFRPAAAVATPSWTTALGVTLASIHGRNHVAELGVDYLLNLHGTEADDWLAKVISKLMPQVYLDRDPNLPGWPWRPNATSWIEPTAHAIVALQVAESRGVRRNQLRQRVAQGQKMILSLRCKDGGWNYGSRSAQSVDLPSYPETTGVALLGLQGRPDAELKGPISHAQELASTPGQPPLAQAWLRVSLALFGSPMAEGTSPAESVANPSDILIAAVEALGAPGGNARLLNSNLSGAGKS